MPQPAKTPAAKRTRQPRKPAANPVENPVPVEPGTLVPARNGGRIRSGSKPGMNGPGPGRPASAIREHLRGSFADRMHILEQIADGEALVKIKGPSGESEVTVSAEVSDRIKALDMMGKYGLGKNVSEEDVRQKLLETFLILQEECSRDVADRIIERMRPVWR
jgi:hypothetical protein